MTMPGGLDAILIGSIGLGAVVVALGLWLRFRILRQVRARLPGSPMETLDQRFASGEISAEEYQYERYLLQKRE